MTVLELPPAPCRQHGQHPTTAAANIFSETTANITICTTFFFLPLLLPMFLPTLQPLLLTNFKVILPTLLPVPMPTMLPTLQSKHSIKFFFTTKNTVINSAANINVNFSTNIFVNVAISTTANTCNDSVNTTTHSEAVDPSPATTSLPTSVSLYQQHHHVCHQQIHHRCGRCHNHLPPPASLPLEDLYSASDNIPSLPTSRTGEQVFRFTSFRSGFYI